MWNRTCLLSIEDKDADHIPEKEIWKLSFLAKHSFALMFPRHQISGRGVISPFYLNEALGMEATLSRMHP